jgi:CRISPR-associated protein Cas2
MLFIVAYDIPEDGTRNQIAAELENWGQRVQYSVFECDLDLDRARKLEARLRSLVSGVDNVRMYPLCDGCRRRLVTIGGKPIAESPPFYQV